MYNKRGISGPTSGILKVIIILVLIIVIGYFFVKGVLRIWNVIF